GFMGSGGRWGARERRLVLSACTPSTVGLCSPTRSGVRVTRRTPLTWSRRRFWWHGGGWMTCRPLRRRGCGYTGSPATFSPISSDLSVAASALASGCVRSYRLRWRVRRRLRAALERVPEPEDKNPVRLQEAR